MNKLLQEFNQPFRYTSERSRRGLTMAVAQADEALYAVVSGEAPAVIGDVIAVMQRIDVLLANDDGLKWFNRMYLMVTQAVDLHPPDGGWKDPDWLLALDVVFAGFYLRAIAGYLSGDQTVPVSWQVLMEARYTPGDRQNSVCGGRNERAHQSRSGPGAAGDGRAEERDSIVGQPAVCGLSGSE